MAKTPNSLQHDPTILVLAGLILVGLLGLPPCNNPGCAEAFCFLQMDASEQAFPMGFQSIDPAFIEAQKPEEQEPPTLFLPKAKRATSLPDTTETN